MTNIDLKDLYIYMKSLEVNKKELDNRYEEKFYQNIDKIIREAKIFEQKLQNTQYNYHLSATSEYQVAEIKCMHLIIGEIYNNIDSLFNRDSTILEVIELASFSKLKSIILKPLIIMIDSGNNVKINDIEFNSNSLIEVLFHIISLIIFNVYPEEKRIQWINSEFTKPNQYSKLEIFIYTAYVKEIIKSYKNIENISDESKSKMKYIFDKINSNKEIVEWNINKIFHKSNFLEGNTPNFILLLLFGTNSYKRNFTREKLSNANFSFEDYMIKLNSILEKIDDKSFNNLNLFKLNKIGNNEYSNYLAKSKEKFLKLLDQPEKIEIINKKFIYGFYDLNEENTIHWTFITNVIVGYFIDKKLEIKPNFILNEIFAELTESDLGDNEIINGIILGSTIPTFKKYYNVFFSTEIRKKIKLDNFEIYTRKESGQISQYFEDKLRSFYENEFRKELINFLDKYYKDNYDINNNNKDIHDFDMILIDILYSNFDVFKLNEKSLDNFMYAWIYYHDMRGYYLESSLKSNNFNEYYYMNFFTDNKFASPVVSTSYNKKNVINLIKKNIIFDDIDISKINPIVFVDNNMLSSYDRIKFNHMECSGDVLYRIIIVHLKLNAKINSDNKIDYFSQEFQNQLCKTLNISKIVQSNGLHFGDNFSFPDADYFEAFIYDFYLKFGYKEAYKLIKKLLKINWNNFVTEEKIIDDIEKEYKILIAEDCRFLSSDNLIKLLLFFDNFYELNNIKNEEQKRKIVKKLLNVLYDSFITFAILSKEDNSQKLRSLEGELGSILNARSYVSYYDEKTYDYIKLFSILEKEGLEIVIDNIIEIFQSISRNNDDTEI